MEILELFMKGLVIGLVIAAPVGPIGFLCISRTLEYGTLIGLATGLGAAAADAVYGAVAALGLMQVAAMLAEQEQVLRLVGGLVLCAIGMRGLLLVDRKGREQAIADGEQGVERVVGATPQTLGITGSFGSSFLLTLANPLTILGFIAFFAAVGWARDLESRASAGILVVGVFLGSAIWWLGLAGAASMLSSRMGSRHRLWIQRLSSAVIFGFGIFALLSLVL